MTVETFRRRYHGQPMEVDGTEGICSIDEDGDVYFCSNSRDWDGAIAKEKFGKRYSYYLRDNRDIEKDGVKIAQRFHIQARETKKFQFL